MAAFAPLLRKVLPNGASDTQWAGSAWASAPPPKSVVSQSSPKPSPIISVSEMPPAGGSLTPSVSVPGTAPAQPVPDVSAIIRDLLAQGSSQQQAFTGAVQSLVSAGIPVTPQTQAGVASQVSETANGASPWIIGGAVVLGLGLVFALSKRRLPRRSRR